MEPTIYEWAGGEEAFARWLNAFYDLVEEDEELAGLFGGRVSEEHRRNVTLWWCEVMGGPPRYTEDHGGYEHMLAKHRGLGITADMRLRFVTMLSRAADLAGLPDDPELPGCADGLRRVGDAARPPELAAGGRHSRARPGPALGLGRGAAVPPMRRVAVAVLVVLAGCGGGDPLPESVRSFEERLEAPRGVLHVVTEEIRVVPEPNMPDLPLGGWSDEVWLDLAGSGWRAHRTTRDGGFEQVADERGIRTYARGGLVGTDAAAGEDPAFRMRPWRAGVVVDPVRLVREGRLEVVSEAEVDGRPAYLAVVDPDPSQNTRLYIAQDDGTLLRLTHRRERRGRLRMVVQDYVVFEVGGRLPQLNLARLIGLE